MGQITRKQFQITELRERNQQNSDLSKSLIDSRVTFIGKSKQVQNKLQKQMQLKQSKIKQKIQWYSKVFFTPESTFIIVLNGITLVLMYFYLLQIPITLAFEKHRNGHFSQNLFLIVNIIAIVIFIISVAVKLKTSFYKEGILISDQLQILKNYLMYTALFDIPSISAIIIYQILIMNNITDFRLIVLLFYLKIPEIVSVEESLASYLDLKRKTKAFVKLILLIAKIFMLCNLAGCFFFFISERSCINQYYAVDSCWLQLTKSGKPLLDGDWTLQYVFSLYWASTTMMTIGYGDLTPQNFNQAAYTVMAQFISCILFAFSINEVWSIIQQKNSKLNKIHTKINLINVYMRDKNVGHNLKSRVNSYLLHFYHTKNLRQKQLQNEIISQLTPVLRKELCFQSYGFIFKNNKFFQKFTNQFLEKASEGIREVGFFQEQIIYQPFSQSKISLYYIFKGQLTSFVEFGTFPTQNITLQFYEKGCILGLYEFVRQLNYCHSLKAVKYSLLYVLDYENWMNALLQNEKDCQRFYEIKHKAQYRNNFNFKKVLQIFCKICGSNQHQSDLCLHDQIQKLMEDFLTRYLEKAERKSYPRRNFKVNANEIKSQSHAHLLHESAGMVVKSIKFRKQSLILSKKQIARPQTLKKLIVQKNAHNEKMQKIILRQKLKQVEFAESQHYTELMTSILMRIQSVQNYETYHPKMNANHIEKENRRMTVNKMLSSASVL